MGYCYSMHTTMQEPQVAEMGQLCAKLKIPGSQETFGGYECEFVELPPSVFHTECPVCNLILREPDQVTCCGTDFCHTCIQRLQAEKIPCPNCRENIFEVFPNKGLNRSLKQLQVYCTHRKKGCQWREELGKLDQHLNVCNECSLTVVEKEKERETGEGIRTEYCR